VRIEADAPVNHLHGSAHTPSRARLVAVGTLYILLIASVIPWRSQTIYSGGLDFVVVAKALIALIAFGSATLLAVRTRDRISIGIGPAAVMTIVMLVSALGALVAGNGAATIVLVLRVFLVMATILILLTTVPWTVSIRSLLTGMALVGVVAAVTGLPGLVSSGRLGGGIPEIHPNELAGLAGAPLIGLVIVMLRRGVRLNTLVASVILLTIAVATGSRTGLAAIVFGIVVAVLVNGIRDRSVVYALLGCLPLGYAIASFTNVFGSLATRAGSTDTTSALDSRFDAWKVVLGWGWDEWQKWIGLGLSAKTVPVDIKWRDEQVLDSSWVSILAQSGLIGVTLVAALLLWCVVTACISASRRWLVLPLLVLVIFRSTTESGLVDSAMPFLTLMVLASVLTHRSRHGGSVSAHQGTESATWQWDAIADRQAVRAAGAREN
jgi:O-antigen ligase